MARDLLSHEQADKLAEAKEKVGHKRIHRVKIGAEERVRKMHKQDLDQGRISPRIQTMGVCMRFDCENRDYECDDCFHFNRYEAVKICPQI